ncbi:benzoate 4-monooxygenase cytochrome p450 [Moniliophthora roreri MCA 2997]|uniref:Benzoate 4-monooxygenase cytochrome p450 n=1 Tax=Moniliophthora roreri (strain MCA 2997) TaxID=1381753 RepID=V2X075_MONRO|nr:benzoate 4-monooxygenase cytochrome p450 [Moniliophthora roreri MCA 2997]
MNQAFIAIALAIAVTLFVRLVRPDPLKRNPGPLLARWTWLYRAYYDIVVGGGWVAHLHNLHEQYGPVVRVGRNELHFTEPAAYADIYNSPYKMPKDPDLYRRAFEIGLPPGVFSVVNAKDHSEIKSLFSSYFSRKSVLKLENVIQERIDKLISQLLKNHKTIPASMNHAFRCVTLDVISLYTLRTNPDTTSFPTFHHPAILGVDDSIAATWVFKHLTLLKNIAIRLPTWLIMRILPTSSARLEIQAEIEKQVDIAMRDSQKYDPDSESNLNVFYTLLSNARIEGKLRRPNRVSREWLITEGTSLQVAGSDTVGNACTIGARCLVRDNAVRAKLVQELETAWPDQGNHLPLERLEKLPYLTAVIKESLRLSFGVVSPMNRVAPEGGAVIAGHPVPPGTIVSIANPFVHMNPEIFPDPARFNPERWLEDKVHSLDRYLVSFGKGPRSCLGINLAWCELYLILGNIFRKLDFHGDSDLRSEVQYKDFFVPLYKGDVLSATVSERL